MHKKKKILSKNQKCQHVVIGGNQMSQSFGIVFFHFSPLQYTLKNSLKKYTKQYKVIATNNVQSETQWKGLDEII